MKTLTVNDAERDRYWRRPVDTRRQMLVFARNIWKLIPAVVAGGILGALIWMGYHALADGTTYRAYSEFYLDFAMTDNGEAYDYYNGYTWNDLMTTDRIAGHTLENLNGETDIAGLERATLAEILSDIRVLRVTFTDSDEALCGDIQRATEQALVTFGEEAREFEQISVIKTVTPERMVADDRILQAVMLGAIIGLLIALAVMNFRYLLDDTVMVPSDLSDLGLDLLGITTSDHDEKLESRLNAYLTADGVKGDGSPSDGVKGDGSLSDASAGTDHVYLDASQYQTIDAALPEAGKGASIIISIPYRRVSRSAVALLADRLTAGGHEVAGVRITDADSRFYRAYYAFETGDKG